MKTIKGFFEDGYILHDSSQRSDRRCKMDFRGAFAYDEELEEDVLVPNVYMTSDACGSQPVGSLDLFFGVSPDPNEPVVSRFASVYDRTLGRPTEASGFRILGHPNGDRSALVIERICCNDKWIATENDYRGYRIWQAEPAPRNVAIDPLQTNETDDATNFFTDQFTQFTQSDVKTNLITAAVAIVVITALAYIALR